MILTESVDADQLWTWDLHQYVINHTITCFWRQNAHLYFLHLNYNYNITRHVEITQIRSKTTTLHKRKQANNLS